MRVESLALSIPFNFDLAVLKHTRHPVLPALKTDRLEAGPYFEPMPRLIAMRIAQLFACPVNPVGHCQFETAAFQFSLVFEAVLNVFIEIGPGFTPTGKQHGFVALILWQIKPVFGCRFHAVVRLDHPVAQQFERVTGAPNIGKRCNSAQFRRSLAQILIHICGGKPACLRYRKGFTGINGQQLLAVANQHKFIHAGDIGDLSKGVHLVIGNHRCFVDDQIGAIEHVARFTGPLRMIACQQRVMLHQETCHRHCFQTGSLFEIGNHLVLEGQAQGWLFLKIENIGDGTEHGRFTSSCKSLDGNNAVTRSNDRACSRHLPII